MILTIWRHGEAERGARDRARALTAVGYDDIGFGCRQFYEACNSRKLPHPDCVLYSPWTRTAQTAEIIAGAFTHARAKIETALQPGSDLPAVDAALRGLQASEPAPAHVLLVSHQPLVSRLADHYLGEAALAPPLCAGGLATLRMEGVGPGCGTLQFWAMPPEYEAGM
jgi:phosphohistidine phosphatase SixA